ncbi:MAG: DinB family protein [Caldilineaceae bacterium]|nr:DinB family protein [Caldilineaceae bacterium]
MPHPLVDQLRFARSEFVRCLDGVNNDDARRRLEPMNCISWIIGHLSAQEDAYWNGAAQTAPVAPHLRELLSSGQVDVLPPLDEMWSTWGAITAAADRYLDTVTAEILLQHPLREGKPHAENYGTMLYRNIYHYWFHTGEAHAVRQMLGHGELPQFVGDMRTAVFR